MNTTEISKLIDEAEAAFARALDGVSDIATPDDPFEYLGEVGNSLRERIASVFSNWVTEARKDVATGSEGHLVSISHCTVKDLLAIGDEETEGLDSYQYDSIQLLVTRATLRIALVEREASKRH